ncbi:hypothetical protein [Clostridium magnum]|uniref:Uncharacterized protein n=1 Tax=Clostridium magnum DSM 2767 TaxID=1121326 RepID=A0A162SEQ7_9CLOT|nr:hypothetical protein [Clostridium magnum]KZL91147.1 hypothetical protein CLMAG_29050 [Clostridium magnum DSM 2767]SHI17912.1 hypothetical protein SAMN02745944_02961 [Clostridium magnum DSM 2767]
MNREYCIFKEKKPCDNCGECERCDLNSNKKCNNCGKCLEKDGFDMKGIKIDEIIESEGEAKEYNNELEESSKVSNSDDIHYHLSEDNNEEDGYNNILEDYLDDHDDKEENTKETLEDIYAQNDFEDENIEYIDDVEGLSELLEDDDRLSEIANEEFPGFYRIKKDY